MKCYLLIILLAYLIFNSFFISAQPFDTLLTQFSSIREIAPLNDGTSILIGDRKNSVRVARIDSNANIMWMRILTDTFFYTSAEVEFNTHESDSTIQIITKRTSCDIVLEGVASLFTLDFKGNIKDTVYIPLLSAYQRTYILSGNDTLPRCATIFDKKVILRYNNGDTIIITPEHEILTPKLVDMCPSGGLIIAYDIGFLRYYQKSGNNFHAVSGGYSSPGALQMICLDEKHIVYRFEDKILSTDTTGLGEYNSIISDNSYFYELVFNSPYIYAKSLSPIESDTVYVLDHEAELIYKEPVDQKSQFINSIALHDSIVFRVGHDYFKFFPAGVLLSEHLETHEGPRHFDVSLNEMELPVPDSFAHGSKCGFHYAYYFSFLSVTITNNSDYLITDLMVGYDEIHSHCCNRITWERKLTEMNIMPGETKTFKIPDFISTRSTPFEGPFSSCISIWAPDQHADDYPDDNDKCLSNIATTINNIDKESNYHYPDPVENFLFINFAGLGTEVKIFDLNGRLVITQLIKENIIGVDVSHFTPGMYIMQYYLNVKNIFQEKFIKI